MLGKAYRLERSKKLLYCLKSNSHMSGQGILAPLLLRPNLLDITIGCEL